MGKTAKKTPEQNLAPLLFLEKPTMELRCVDTISLELWLWHFLLVYWCHQWSSYISNCFIWKISFCSACTKLEIALKLGFILSHLSTTKHSHRRKLCTNQWTAVLQPSSLFCKKCETIGLYSVSECTRNLLMNLTECYKWGLHSLLLEYSHLNSMMSFNWLCYYLVILKT